MAIDSTAGSATAVSYASVATVDAYFLARSNATWAALTNAQKESALVVATAFLDASYGSAWVGYRASTTQALDWPRTYVYLDGVTLSDTTIPSRIVSATCELALRASAGELLADITEQSVKREKVDVIEVEYFQSSSSGNVYGYVSRLLSPLIYGAIGNSTFQTARMLRV